MLIRFAAISAAILTLSACEMRSIEQQCDGDMQQARFNSYQECLAFRQGQQESQAAAFRNAGQSLRQQHHPASQPGASRVDLTCQSNCLNQGYTMQLCNSKCSY